MPDKAKPEEFFIADKTEALVGNIVTLNLDLSKIDYDDFEFTLSSNFGVNDVIVNEEDITTELSENVFVITGNKSKLSVDKISLSYVVPENAAVGTKIDLKGSIKNIGVNSDDEEDEESAETTSQEETNDIEAKEITITIAVVEKNQNKSSQGQQQTQSMNQNKSQNQAQGQATQTQSKSKTQGQGTNSTVEINAYKGESNNYLSKLEIKNYDINPVFEKTNNTYFIIVDSAVTKLNITAEAEDDDAIVNIYGNTDLKTGINKILRSVTAENGDVKTYRIYVTSFWNNRR